MMGQRLLAVGIRARGSRARRGGFTLIEIMLALVVLTVAVTAFLGASVQNVQLEQMNAETVTALNAASEIIESIKSLSFGDVAAGGIPETFEAEMTGNDGKVIHLSDSEGSQQVGHVTVSTTSDPKVLQVEVLVTWRSIGGDDRSIRIMTEVTDY